MIWLTIAEGYLNSTVNFNPYHFTDLFFFFSLLYLFVNIYDQCKSALTSHWENVK